MKNIYGLTINKFNISILIFITIVSVTGCAFFTKTIPGGMGRKRIFQEDYNLTWDAAMAALEGLTIKMIDTRRGRIMTDWGETLSDRTTRGLIFVKRWKSRYRVLITITSLPSMNAATEVSIAIHGEEKAPGGTLASGWRRKQVDSRHIDNLFEKITEYMSGVRGEY